MVRCPRCGVRLRVEAPICPAHGAALAPSSGSDDSLDGWARGALAQRGVHVGELLGRGGFGHVYTLRDDAGSVLKVANPEREAMRRLGREALALARIGPPHAPALRGQANDDELAYLVLERIVAPTLADVLAARAGPLPWQELLPIAQALFHALEATHAHGIAHLDIKPENVFVAAQARIIDFGSCLLPAPCEQVDTTLGTPEYMAPEQCAGRAVDARTDLYSLGVVLYELASGAPPFLGSAADVRDAQLSARPPPLSRSLALPPGLSDVLRRCLEKDPGQRYATVDALRGAFSALASERTVAAPPSEPGATRAPTRSEKRPVALLFFHSDAGLGRVQSALAHGGGELAHQRAGEYGAAFSHDAAENPVHTAVRVAQALLATRTAQRVLVELATVSLQLRPDGSRRVVSSLFARRDRYRSEGPALVLTRAAAEVVPELPLEPLADGEHFALAARQEAREQTSFALEVAPLIGQDGLLASVRTSVAEAFEERRPTLFTVLGESGLGKSRIARALGSELALRNPPPDVIRIGARELSGELEPRILPELLRRLLDLPHDEAAARRMLRERFSAQDERASVAARYAIGWLAPQDPELRAIAAAPGALRALAARATSDALRRRAALRPLVLIVDDAHLAEDAALDALELATLDDARLPLWICVCARTSLTLARPSWAQRADRAPRRELAPLPVAAAEALARELLKPVEHVPPTALARLYERTQGVPGLLVELVRGLRREGLVRRSERGTGHYLATDALDKLPAIPVVLWNASRELEALPPALAEHARLVAVLGTSCDASELEAFQRALEQAGERVLLDGRVGLERLVEAGILLRRRDGRYEFRNALLHDTLYERIAEPARSTLHRAALSAYQRGATRQLANVARHAARAGERATAAAAYLELAALAQAGQSYLTAERSFAAALELLEPQDPRVVAAARGRALMRFRLGRHEDALTDLTFARSAAGDDGARTLELALDQATVLDWLRDFARSAAVTREALSHAPADPPPLSRARLALSVARVHHRQGEAEACVRVGSEAAECARALGDDGYETRLAALLMVAPDCVNLGRLDEAERAFDLAIAEAEAHGDQHHLGAAYNNRALLWFVRRDAARSFADLARGARIARELGAPLIEYPARINMGEVAYALEQLDAALEHTARAMALARALWGEDNRELGMCELLLARIALHRGDLSEARARLVSMQRRVDDAHKSGSNECDFLPPEQRLLEMVELALADAPDEAWEALEQRCRAIDLQPQEQLAVLECRALTALRAGRRMQAEQLFDRALALSNALPNLLSERVERAHAELRQLNR